MNLTNAFKPKSMNRRNFFKDLFYGIAALSIPSILLQELKKEKKPIVFKPPNDHFKLCGFVKLKSGEIKCFGFDNVEIIGLQGECKGSASIKKHYEESKQIAMLDPQKCIHEPGGVKYYWAIHNEFQKTPFKWS